MAIHRTYFFKPLGETSHFKSSQQEDSSLPLTIPKDKWQAMSLLKRGDHLLQELALLSDRETESRDPVCLP